MGRPSELEQKMEARAREIAKSRGMPESMWELCLMDAYMEGFDPPADDGSEPEPQEASDG